MAGRQLAAAAPGQLGGIALGADGGVAGQFGEQGFEVCLEGADGRDGLGIVVEKPSRSGPDVEEEALGEVRKRIVVALLLGDGSM